MYTQFVIAALFIIVKKWGKKHKYPSSDKLAKQYVEYPNY